MFCFFRADRLWFELLRLLEELPQHSSEVGSNSGQTVGSVLESLRMALLRLFHGESVEITSTLCLREGGDFTSTTTQPTVIVVETKDRETCFARRLGDESEYPMMLCNFVRILQQLLQHVSNNTVATVQATIDV